MEAMQSSSHVECLAVDQRGCGRSDLGQLQDFSQATLVQDLEDTIQAYLESESTSPSGEEEKKKKKKIVLVGHSLGGRIALGYAATFPERLAACVIEDMDIAPREPSQNGFVVLKDYKGLFHRAASTKDELVERFLAVGYPQSFIDKALDEGRIEQEQNDHDDGSWWSHVNPDFRKYCYQHVLSTTQGQTDCDTIAEYNNNKVHDPIPCHILVANEEGTVCKEESIQDMKQRLKNHATVHRFPTAGHSIHNTASEEFLATLSVILQSVGE